MKALVYDTFGGPDVLTVRDVPDPKVGPDTVLVAVRATSVNPVDWKMMAGHLEPVMDMVFPVVPGWDVAGVVEAVGPAVTEFAPGDEVFGYVRKDFVHGGTFADKVAAPVRTLAHKPATLSFAEAGGLPLTGLTAYQSLVHKLGVGSGDTVLVHGAAGGVGTAAVQIAAARGATVIGTASESHHEYLRGLGATAVTYGDGLVERVRKIAPDGVSAALDLYGGDSITASDELLTDKTRIASIADATVAERGGSYVFVRPDAADLAALAELADAGSLRVPIAGTFPLSGAADAFAASIEGHTEGKIVVEVA